MTESRPASDGPATPAGSPAPFGLIAGWAVTALGALVIAATFGVTLYLVLSADTPMQFVGWFFAMLFFGAFPAMMGLGLVIWGGRIVRRSRSKRPSG